MSDTPDVDPFATRPLLSFSLYTDVQADIIRRVGAEILGITSKWTNVIDNHQRAYDLFWLWILGAYELTRTMDEFSGGFSTSMKERTKEIKIFIAELRMPFAKQQLRGKRTTVYAELSIVGIQKGMQFKIEGKIFNSTNVIERFIDFLDSITFDDLGVKPLSMRGFQKDEEPGAV